MNSLPAFETILANYGETVSLYRDGTLQGAGLAVLRPILERTRQALPTPLGVSIPDTYLCLGERALPFLPRGELQLLSCGNEWFFIKNVRPIKLGRDILYWRVILELRKGGRV